MGNGHLALEEDLLPQGSDNATPRCLACLFWCNVSGKWVEWGLWAVVWLKSWKLLLRLRKRNLNVWKGEGKLLLKSPVWCRPNQTDKTKAFSPAVEPGLAQWGSQSCRGAGQAGEVSDVQNKPIPLGLPGCWVWNSQGKVQSILWGLEMSSLPCSFIAAPLKCLCSFHELIGEEATWLPSKQETPAEWSRGLLSINFSYGVSLGLALEF